MNRMLCYFLLLASLFSVDPLLAEGAKTSLEVGAPSQDLTASMFKVIGGLLVVILTIFVSAWFFRRFGNMPSISNKSLKIVGGLSISQKDRVILLQVGEEQLLLGVSPGRIQTLHVLNNPVDIDQSGEQEKKKFSTQLNSAIKNWKS